MAPFLLKKKINYFSAAKEVIRIHGDSVNWWHIVWFKGHVPRMAFKRKILTKAKFKTWGCIKEDMCSVC